MKLLKHLCGMSLMVTCFVLLANPGKAQSRGMVKGNGNIQSQVREVSGFNTLDCSGSYHIILTQGGTTGLKVEADENLMPYIITEVKGNHLELRTKPHVRIEPSRPVNIYVTVNRIKDINISGSSEVKSTNTLKADQMKLAISGSSEMNLDFDAQSVYVGISGSGKLTLSGNSASSAYHISGSGDIEAAHLVTDDAEIHISGMGKLHVNSKKKLDVAISGMGKVWYTGAPEISQSVSGMGKIAKE